MTDIYSAVKPLLYVSNVLGLGPFSIDDESRTVSSRKSGVAYSLAIFALYASVSTYAVYFRFQTTAGSFTYIGEYTSLVLLMCGIVVAFCCLLLVVVQRKKIVAMIESFHGVDGQMLKLDVRAPYVRLTRISVGIVIGLVVLLISLFVHDYLATVEPLDVFFWITYFAPVVYTTIMQCQFVSGGLLLRRNFAYLNERLAKFGTEDGHSDSGNQKKFVDGGYFESHLIRRSSEHAMDAWERDFSKFRIRKIVPRDGLITPPLSALSKLLSTVAQAFVIITTNLYTLFTSGSSATSHTAAVGSGQTIGISFPILWALFRSLELVCITVTCTKISKTANHTAVIVHKLLARDWDSNIRSQLKLFSIQLLHRKISFSACGFFTLDMTLLHAIIGAATTYLVILIQFHNTYEESS